MVIFQYHISVNFWEESEYYAKTVENLDDAEGIVAQTKE